MEKLTDKYLWKSLKEGGGSDSFAGMKTLEFKDIIRGYLV